MNLFQFANELSPRFKKAGHQDNTKQTLYSPIRHRLFNIRFYYSRICRQRNNFPQIKFIFIFLQHQDTWWCVNVLMLLLWNNIKTDFCYSIRHIITHWINYPTQAIWIHNSILCLSLVISMEHILSITILRFTIS